MNPSSKHSETLLYEILLSHLGDLPGPVLKDGLFLRGLPAARAPFYAIQMFLHVVLPLALVWLYAIQMFHVWHIVFFVWLCFRPHSSVASSASPAGNSLVLAP